MKSTTPAELRVRTKEFAIKVIRFVRSLPKTEEGRVIGRQLLRSATSVGANYRAVCLARSKAEFVAKIGVVLEEADECIYWLELLEDAAVLPKGSASSLHREAGELAAIFAASFRTARSGRKSEPTDFNNSVAQ
ncbi:MAG: four helix bundle protein [Planctomycetes bacterium]|nr:four helix bundle protein [Planctomycetota bacterium]